MEAARIAAILEKSRLFSVLDEKERLQLAERAQVRRLVRGQPLFVKDQPGDSLYVVAEGQLRIVVYSQHGDITELGRSRPHDVVGEVAALGKGVRSATVEAAEPSQVVALYRNDLIPLLQSSPALLDAVLEALCSLIYRADGQITNLVFLDLKALVAAKLLELKGPDGFLGAQITQAELARMVGGTRQSVNQILRRFDQRGWIRTVGRRYQVLKPDELRHLTEQ